MDDKHQTKAAFVTKLSLPKFIAMIQRLTPDQIKLVRSMGFEHLLELKCNFLPRGVIHWLASNFDVHSRSFDLPNGFKFMITPFCIHQVLGIPLGGRRIGRKVDAAFRAVIAEETNCKGNYPTIAELDGLIKPGLDGVTFKRVFTMYTLAAFLCPSSHGAVSPEYYHILEDPENIASFDFSTTVLDKIVASIDTYKGGETTVLGGNMLTLAIIHFEFLDTEIIQVSSKWPRLSIWTSEIVEEYERMDCISTERLLYGRLPTKQVSQTPFSRCNSQYKFPVSSAHNELLQFLLSIIPEESHRKVMDELPSIMENMRTEMFESIQPVLTKSIISLLNCVPSGQISVPESIPTLKNMDAYHEVAPKLSGRQHASDLRFEAPPFNPETQSATKLDRVPRFKCTKGQQADPKADVDEETTPMTVSLNYQTKHLQELSLSEFFIFQEPSNEILARWDEEGCGKIPDIQDLVKTIGSIKLSTELDLPNYPDLLEDMVPKKIQVENFDFQTPTTLDLLSYMLEDKVYWEKRRHDTREYHSIDLFERFDSPSSYDCINGSRNSREPPMSGEVAKQNKRSTCLSLNEMSANCIALKKRARMFERTPELAEEINDHIEHTLATNITPLGESIFNSEDVNLSPHTPPHGNTCRENSDFPWDDHELVTELIESTDRIVEQYLSQKRQSPFITPQRERIHIAEISPENFCCSFVSTPVEKEVFIDIIARVPRTSKQKTVKIVQMGTTWAEHRVFALSMQVYGRVIKYVINMMGKAVIVEQVERERFGLLPPGHRSKYFMECDIAALFKQPFENPGSLAVYLRNNIVGFMLDKINMVHMPLFTSGFWYLIVANFRKKLFEVLCPNTKINLIVDEANNTIKNFKGAFSIAYKHSKINVFEMETTFHSVCSSNKEADSGVFAMKMIQSHDGETTLCFEPEHAKPLRESLTYYMLAHPFNERLPPETKAILRKHGIAYDWTACL